MPPRRPTAPNGATAAETEQPGTALAIPGDVMQDLLKQQRDQVKVRRLPQVKIMPAAAGLFEFADTNDTEREIVAVILNTHPRNVLWDKGFGQGGGNADEKPKPACQSPDGLYGTPRVGFAHANLDHEADGTERIACATCKYNQWGSKPLIPALMRPGDSGKGKAVTNQRSLYLLISGRAMPYELVLPPTSIAPFDEYLLTLLNRSIPVQAVFTRLTQERKEKGAVKWAQMVFANAGMLSQEQFNQVMGKREQFAQAMNPALIVDEEEPTPTATPAQAAAAAADDEIPF